MLARVWLRRGLSLWKTSGAFRKSRPVLVTGGIRWSSQDVPHPPSGFFADEREIFRQPAPPIPGTPESLAEIPTLPREEIAQRVAKVLEEFPKIDKSKIAESANFEKDLGLDSLDSVELVVALEAEFGVDIPDAHVTKIYSFSSAVDYIKGLKIRNILIT
mmetsp:Transcript_11808/g.17120  ORF Transcript_11808/g.17120 Transcript_11808/m.17120 type:complete len:160 (-) Transcript_11808:271-750(-)